MINKESKRMIDELVIAGALSHTDREEILKEDHDENDMSWRDFPGIMCYYHKTNNRPTFNGIQVAMWESIAKS